MTPDAQVALAFYVLGALLVVAVIVHEVRQSRREEIVRIARAVGVLEKERK